MLPRPRSTATSSRQWLPRVTARSTSTSRVMLKRFRLDGRSSHCRRAPIHLLRNESVEAWISEQRIFGVCCQDFKTRIHDAGRGSLGAILQERFSLRARKTSEGKCLPDSDGSWSRKLLQGAAKVGAEVSLSGRRRRAIVGKADLGWQSTGLTTSSSAHISSA